MRTLFKKVYVFRSGGESVCLCCSRSYFFALLRHAILNEPKLPVSAFVTALNWMGIDADIDEAECLLATLISDVR